jgi:hypothetical protein
MEKRFGIKKLFAFALFTCLLLIPMSFAIAGNQPPSGLKSKGPVVIADMYFTPTEYTGVGICKGSIVEVKIAESVVTEDQFDDINRETLLDQYLAFPEILVLKDNKFAEDCVPEDAEGMFVQAVPFFDEGDDNYKTARLILLFAVP